MDEILSVQSNLKPVFFDDLILDLFSLSCRENAVNLPFDAKVEDVNEVYDLAWKLKCKGVTVFRYGSKPEQVLYIGEVKGKEGKFVSAESEYAGGCPTQNCPFPG